MTRKNISNAVSNINAEYIENAADYKTTRKVRKSTWRKVGSMAACLCLCALLGICVWQSGMLNTPISSEQSGAPNTQQGQNQPSVSQNENNANVGGDEAATDVQGRVMWNGADYIQINIVSADQVVLGEYLGEVADFEGSYKEANVNGGLYTVKDNDELLCAKLDGRFFDGGDYVLLHKLQGANESAAADVQGRVALNGADYIQIDIVSAEQVALGEYLGKVADFEGYYKDNGTVGDLYTIKGNDKLLCAKLESKFFDGGDYVLLEKIN